MHIQVLDCLADFLNRAHEKNLTQIFPDEKRIAPKVAIKKEEMGRKKHCGTPCPQQLRARLQLCSSFGQAAMRARRIADCGAERTLIVESRELIDVRNGSDALRASGAAGRLFQMPSVCLRASHFETMPCVPMEKETTMSRSMTKRTRYFSVT